MTWFRQLRVQAFGCIKDATVDLTSLHAVIGPNDSGKSTLLRAIETASLLLHDSNAAAPQAIKNYLSVDTRIDATLSDGTKLVVSVAGEGGLTCSHVASGMSAPVYVRFSPSTLRAPENLYRDAWSLELRGSSGVGLGALYDALLSRNLDGYLEIREQVRKLFPTVADVNFPNVEQGRKTIALKLIDGTIVPADAISDGILYFLAFSALQHLQGTGPYLVEEPENGLHPARIADVIDVLRIVSESNQVVLATHSPLVINELQPQEVSLVTRPETGTRITPIVDTPNFEKRSSVYSLGELWLAYADGEQETALIPGASDE